jgi:hypothetical protein
MVVTETWALQHGYRHVPTSAAADDTFDECPDG